MPVTKPQDVEFIKTLILGDIGSGKTRFLGTAQLDPRTSPILVIDFEGGTKSLKGLDVDVFRAKDWNDFDEAYSLVADPHTKYKSVAVDSASETHIYTLFNILEEEKEDRRKKKQRTDQFFEADYGTALVIMRRFLRSFRDLDMHVFFTSLAMEQMEPGFGMIKKPSFAGKMSNEVPMLMDIVGGMTWLPNPEHDNELERVMLLKNYPEWRVKIRTDFNAGDVPDEIYSPDVTKLFNLLGIPYPDGTRSE